MQRQVKWKPRPKSTRPPRQLLYVKIVDAVAYLHEHNIVHHDLKLENILLVNKQKPSVKTDAKMDTEIRLIGELLSYINVIQHLILS
jgi:serine/threonine protein kinase